MTSSKGKRVPRLLFLTATFAPVLGGTERRASLLAGALARRGFSLTVLTQRPANCPVREVRGDVEVLRLSPAPGGKTASALFILRAALFLLRRGKEFDLVQVFLASSPALLVRFWTLFLQRPALLAFGGGGPTGDVGTSLRSSLGRWKLRRLRKGFDFYLCPNAAVREEFLARNYPAEKMVVFPNGVDTSFFRPAGDAGRDRIRRDLGWEGRTVILYAGRLEGGKNLPLLLDAWKAVVEGGPGPLLCIAGEGAERGGLERKIAACGLADSVRLPGALDGEGVRRFLQGADLFVLPSLAEGMSNALLEAMSCGLPAVASDIPGNREVVEDGVSGRLFRLGGTEGLTAALGGLMANPDERRRMGNEARRAVQSRFGVEHVAQRYLELVAPLVAEDRAAR